MAREIAAREGIDNGLVYVLSAVEPCWSFEIHRNRAAKRLELQSRRRRCLHLYHYMIQRLSDRAVLIRPAERVGKRVPQGRNAHPKFTGQVVSDLKERPEGMRLKHAVNGNSVKMYATSNRWRRSSVKQPCGKASHPCAKQPRATERACAGCGPSTRRT